MLHPLLAHPRALGPYLLLWLVPATLLVGVPLVHEPALWRASVAVAVPLCALYAFAYRNGRGWRVLYVGTRIRHKVDTAIGYGATHLLVRPGAAADEAWLIGDLKPPLNDGWG